MLIYGISLSLIKESLKTLLFPCMLRVAIQQAVSIIQPKIYNAAFVFDLKGTRISCP